MTLAGPSVVCYGQSNITSMLFRSKSSTLIADPIVPSIAGVTEPLSGHNHPPGSCSRSVLYSRKALSTSIQLAINRTDGVKTRGRCRIWHNWPAVETFTHGIALQQTSVCMRFLQMNKHIMLRTSCIVLGKVRWTEPCLAARRA